MNLPSQALDARIELRKWSRSKHGVTFMEGLAMPTENTTGLDPNVMRFIIDQVLDEGEVYAVTSEIEEVVAIASESIPEYSLVESDLPSHHGLIWFENNLMFPDAFGKMLAVKGITWTRIDFAIAAPGSPVHGPTFGPIPKGANTKPGIMTVLWTDPTDSRDHMHDLYMNEFLPGLRNIGYPLNNTGSGYVVPMIGGAWWFTENPVDPTLMPFLMTLLRFMQEPFVETRWVVPSRPVQRRAQRAKIPPKIQVIALRARDDRVRPGHDGAAAEWSHRWLVRGHWRNQWYPTEHRHAPKWISPYVKGPEDKPLVVTERVFHVSR